MFQIILIFLIFTIIYLIFIECYVGSIMIRYNSENKLSFNLWSGLNYLIHPLYNSFLWNKELLHINYIFILGILLILIFIKKFDFKRYLNIIKDGFFERYYQTSNKRNINKDI